MTILLRTGALILFVCLLFACGGSSSDSSSSSGSRNAESPQPEQPDDGSDDGENNEPPPVAADLTTNVFFPVFDNMALYYNADTEPSVLGETIVDGEERVYPLQHPDERVEYFTSTTHEVGLKGLRLRLFEGESPVYLDLDFNNDRIVVGNNTTYSSSGNANVKLTGVVGTYPVPVTLTARRATDEMVEVAGWPSQPARHIHLELRLTVNWLLRELILLRYPWAEPILEAIELDLWFVPGVGIARIQQGTAVSNLNSVEGIPQPHVFDVERNENVNSVTPVQMRVNGEVLTDSEWQSTIYYRTTGEDWLDVAFDGTGSWRASLTRTDLAEGVYAATVRFTRDGVTQDTTVSLLVR